MAKQPKRPTRAQKIAASKAAKEPKTEAPERAKRDFIGQKKESEE